MNEDNQMIEGETVPASPPPMPKPSYLTLCGALKEVLNGKRVTKQEWNDKTVYIYLQDDRLMIHRDNAEHTLIVSRGDIEGQDYFVLPTVN